jgi:phage-related protein
VDDAQETWRVLYRTDPDAVLVVAMFRKKTSTTPKAEIERAKRLLREYDSDG